MIVPRGPAVRQPTTVNSAGEPCDHQANARQIFYGIGPMAVMASQKELRCARVSYVLTFREKREM